MRLGPATRAWSNEPRGAGLQIGIYIGLGWDDREDRNWGTLGYYDKEQLRVAYLSPRIMSWH